MLIFRGGRLVDKQDYLLGEPSALDEMRREFIAQYYTTPDRIPPLVTVDAGGGGPGAAGRSSRVIGWAVR